MISVIIPFFNAAETLDQAVQSIVEQSFTDWELILVDNNSTDQGRRVAEGWVQKDDRIRLLTEVKQGVAYAMNTGLQAAHYDMIARMDADDLTHSTRLEKQFSFMQLHPEVDVLATQVQFTSTLEHHKGFLNYVEWQNGLLSHEDIYNKRFVDASLVQATTLIRRATFERFGYYNTGDVPDDFELWLRWFHLGMRCAKLPEVLYTWRDGLTRLSRSHPDYSTDSFDAMRFKWLSAFLKEERPSRPVIILGTSKLCRERARQLEEHGIKVKAFSDVSGKPAMGYEFIAPDQLGPMASNAFLISMISQRGTGSRISSFLQEQGLAEGKDFLLSA
jgi:glycosyltransferase involved in cell wall biosynthesis